MTTSQSEHEALPLGDLLRPDLVGPRLAEATGDESWKDFSAELIAGGKSNLTFTLRSDAGEVILRRPPTGKLLPSAHDMGREARIQLGLGGTDVPVAKVLLNETTGEDLGVPYYVMEKVVGHVIRDTLPPGFAEDDDDVDCRPPTPRPSRGPSRADPGRGLRAARQVRETPPGGPILLAQPLLRTGYPGIRRRVIEVIRPLPSH